MAGERDPFLGHLGQVGQAHHLIAARIGEDRAIPAHEAMQPAEPRDALGAGAQHQMIGVAEDDVGAAGTHIGRLHRLDRRRRADRHEGRGADIAARRMDDAGAGLSVTGEELELKVFHRSGISRQASP